MNIEEQKDNFHLHPIFSFQDDQYLSSIIAKIVQTENSQTSNFLQIMKGLVFQNYQDPEDMEEVQQATFYTSTFCGRSANRGDICFICLDCNIFSHPDVYAIMCVECFDKSDHKGHRINRVLQEEDDAANCDCGDSQFLNSEGFCSDHQSKPINMEELYENFPSGLLNTFQIIVKKSIYAAVSLIEIQQKNLETKDSISENFVRNMLDFWIQCYSEINKAFLPILWTTLRSQFDSPWNLVWHDCQNFQQATATENKHSPEPHQCTCSLVGNLFRISSLTSRENQEKIKKILADCLKDRDFLEYLSIEFTKYISFFFTQDYPQEFLKYEETSHHSPLLGLYVQLYKDDNTLVKIIDSSYFENFLNLTKKTADYCTKMNLIGSQIIDQIRYILDYFLMPTNISALRLSQDQNFILQYLDVITAYQMKFYFTERLSLDLFDHEINYDSLNITLRTERSLCRPFENLTKLIEKLPQPEQKQRLTQLLQNWHLNLQNAKAALKDEDGKPCQSFDPCLERLFCCIIINHMKDDISTYNLQKFIQESGINVHQLALDTLEGPLRALGMIRYLHLTFHYKSGDLFDVYYYIWNAFFEIDVVTIQMMLLLLKPEERLFQLLVENFFSYSPEIQGFFKDPNEENYEKKLLTIIEDFLYLLVFLITDEVCLLNIQTKYKKDNFDQIDLNPRQKLVIKNLIINILRGFYWTTGKKVKEVYHYFLSTEHEVDQILPQVTVKDEKNHTIRVKDEYESSIDPYIFYRMPNIRQDILQTFTAKNSQKNNSIDLISGVLDKDLPQYLKDIQRNLYQSNLPEFLSNYLKMANLKTGSTLIRLILKLVLLNLQVAEESSTLKQKVKEIYMNGEFLALLENINAEENFKDCRSCIENIKNLLQKVEGNKTMLVENSPRTQKENETKKLTAQERMAQLKQNFAQKQAAFAQKNLYLLQKSMSFQEIGEPKKSEHLVCQHCMEKLHVSGQEYGLLIYITFTNNLYDTTIPGNFPAQDYTNFLKADWWPVISSCNHYFHRKCFEVFYQAPKDFEKNFLNSTYEFFCPLCKGLCNNFLSINGEEKESDEMKQEASQEQLEMYPQIYQTFTKKIQKLLVDLKAKIQLSPAGHATALEEASFVSIETIFERAYGYFIESFYLLDNPRNLEKTFDLYLAFFKGFKTYFKDSDLKIPEDNLQLSAFFNVNNLFLSTQAASPSEELNYKTEVYLIELFAKNLQRILTSASGDISGKSELLALKNFILFKITQTVAFNNTEAPNLKLEDCFHLYQSNQALKSKIFEQLAFPIQKIILSYALNISTASSSQNLDLLELFNLLQNMSSHQEEYLTDLFHAVNIPCSLPELILEIFQELPTRPQSEINFLASLFDNTLFSKETLEPRLMKFSPRMIQLPETYLEFNIRYFHEKCSLCKKFTSHLYTSICLICGEVLCTGYCNNDMNQAGNLNRHVKKYHLGMGIFIDVQSLYQNLINSPINLTYEKKGLYLDDLGQDIASLIKNLDTASLAKLDFSQFKLNQELVKEFSETLNLQTLRKFIFMAGLHEKDKKEDGFL